MTVTSRRHLLWFYLATALIGVVVFRARGEQILLLFSSVVNRQQGPSWNLLPGMGLFVALFAGGVFFAAPAGALFYLAAGYFFGLVNGTVLAVLANTLGSCAAFLFFRRTLPPIASMLPAKNPFLMLALLRCSPWVPGSLVNAYCAASRVALSHFLASVLVGPLPLILVYTATASRLKGPVSLSLLHSPEVIMALSLLGGLSLVGFWRPLRLVVGHLRGLAFCKTGG